MWRFGSAAICLLCSVLHFDEGLGRVGDELPEVHMNVVSTDVHSSLLPLEYNHSVHGTTFSL